MEETDYLTTKQAAEKLGVSVGRVQQLVADKRLPSVKIGRDRFILEKDLELVRERKRTGRPPKPKESSK
ncbi:MAG TPA: helix-turn-helix domain-containing protein [Pyrinomonadaceae bacterium]|jgi:excisionase family DNA binding protein